MNTVNVPENTIVVQELEVVRFVRAHAGRTGESFELVVNKLLEKAMRDAQYRSRRNAQKWAETKVMKERIEELEAAAREHGIEIPE